MTTKTKLRRRVEELEAALTATEIERDAYHSALDEANKLLADTDRQRSELAEIVEMYRSDHYALERIEQVVTKRNGFTCGGKEEDDT